MKKERNSKNRPNKSYLPFFVFAIPSTRTVRWWVNWASFPDTLCTLFKLPLSRIHEPQTHKFSHETIKAFSLLQSIQETKPT
jgi:hypothetical protein